MARKTKASRPRAPSARGMSVERLGRAFVALTGRQPNLAEMVALAETSEYGRPKWTSTTLIPDTGNAEFEGDGYVHPVGADYMRQSIAPWPSIDRYPLRIGSKRTLAYLSSCIRLATIGYRMQLVDLLDELIEQDPHLHGVISKRVLAVARGKITISPADLGEDAPESDKTLAKKIATEVSARFFRISRLSEALVRLAWACYYGIAAAEIMWRRSSDWAPTSLSMVHSRRLAMPEWSQWKLFVWDQGPVSPWESFAYPTQAPLGLCIDELPGKFVVHCPPIRGDYPTREGLGLAGCAYWSMLKHIAARGAPVYLERFAQPLPEMVWSTGVDPKTGEKKPADRRDIEAAQALMSAWGGGRIQQIAHPDTIELKYTAQGAGGGGGKPPVRHGEWIAICDEQISVSATGATLTTKQGVEGGGSRANGDTQRKDQINTWGADADSLADAIRESIVKTDVRCNYRGIDLERFCPLVECSLEEDPDPTVISDRAVKLAGGGYPVDAKKLQPMVGIPLADHKDPNAIVMVPLKPQEMIPPVRPADPDAQADIIAKKNELAANPPPPMQKVDPNTGKTIPAHAPVKALPGGKPGFGARPTGSNPGKPAAGEKR